MKIARIPKASRMIETRKLAFQNSSHIEADATLKVFMLDRDSFIRVRDATWHRPGELRELPLSDVAPYMK